MDMKHLILTKYFIVFLHAKDIYQLTSWQWTLIIAFTGHSFKEIGIDSILMEI